MQAVFRTGPVKNDLGGCRSNEPAKMMYESYQCFHFFHLLSEVIQRATPCAKQ